MHYLDGRNVNSQGFGIVVQHPANAPPPQHIKMNPAKCTTLCAQHGLPSKGVSLTGHCVCGKKTQPTMTPANCTTVCAQHGRLSKGVNAAGHCVCGAKSGAQAHHVAPVVTPIGPPPHLSQNDCASLPINLTQQGVLYSGSLIHRVQAALNYALPSLVPPLALNGIKDFPTLTAWSMFVARYATWDATSQKYLNANVQIITCEGLTLLKDVIEGIYKNKKSFVGPIDDGQLGSSVSNPSLTYEERDKIWILSPDSRPAFRHALAKLTQRVLKTVLNTGNIFVQCQPSSGPIPLGQDALTAVRQKIAAGYAVMIMTGSTFQDVTICYTKHAPTIAWSCSTKGAIERARAGGSMRGFGIDMMASTPAPPPLLAIDPSKAEPPNRVTGLPRWALFEAEPPPLIDAARALFSVTGNRGPGRRIPAGRPLPSGPPPTNYLPPSSSYVYTPYPSGPAATAPPAAAATGLTLISTWALPVALLGGAGLLVYALA